MVGDACWHRGLLSYHLRSTSTVIHCIGWCGWREPVKSTPWFNERLNVLAVFFDQHC